MAEFGKMKIFDADELIAEMGAQHLRAFAQSSEERFMRHTRHIAYRAAWDDDLRLILVSGPTSSGKTTFTKRLAAALNFYGRETTLLSMDDYYLENTAFFADNGLPNYETMDTLDIKQMSRDIRRLLDGERVNLPLFDLKERVRVMDPKHTLQLPKNGILLVEGLHALNPLLRQFLDRKEYYGIFIMPYATLMTAQRALEPMDHRVLRRISRDQSQRGAGALATLDYWPVIKMEEERVFPSYLESADYFFNSIVPYEYFLVPGLAAKQLSADLERYHAGELKQSIFVQNGRDFPDNVLLAHEEETISHAEKLLQICEDLPLIDLDFVPEISILNEFIH
ncbi:MAG: nucleoside kinase [Eubacteriales bacterium]|nr:nucleoside kinase [Eubacteriales bacterium]